jgi:hypothetical protein
MASTSSSNVSHQEPKPVQDTFSFDDECLICITEDSNGFVLIGTESDLTEFYTEELTYNLFMLFFNASKDSDELYIINLINFDYIYRHLVEKYKYEKYIDPEIFFKLFLKTDNIYKILLEYKDILTKNQAEIYKSNQRYSFMKTFMDFIESKVVDHLLLKYSEIHKSIQDGNQSDHTNSGFENDCMCKDVYECYHKCMQ